MTENDNVDVNASLLSFLEEQGEETETKTFSGSGAPEPQIINKEDFDKPEPVVQLPTDQTEKPQVKFDAIKEARNYTALIDMTQNMIFTGIHKVKCNKKVGGKEAFNQAIEHRIQLQEKEIEKSSLSPEELKNIRIVINTQKKIQELPLSDEEKKFYIDALEGIVKENNYRMPPMMMFWIATLNMIVPRAVDAIFD